MGSGLHLHLEDSGGSGPVVVLLHGIGASSHIYDDVLRLGAGRFRFVTVDLTGTGASAPEASMAPGALAIRVRDACLARGIERARVVGHSFGGLVALEWLRQAPATLEGLVLASVPAFRIPFVEGLLGLRGLERLMGLAQRLPPSPLWVKGYLPRIWGTRRRLETRHVQGYVDAMAAEGFLVSTLRATRALAAYRLPEFPAPPGRPPVRLLWGDEDRLTPIAAGRKLAQALQAPLEALEGVGHCLPEEAPEAVLEALEGLEGPDPRSET